MNTIQCQYCEEVLPEYANYCANCGESMVSSGHISARFLVEQSSRNDAFRGSDFHSIDQEDTLIALDKKRTATVNVARQSRPGSSYSIRSLQQTSAQSEQPYPFQAAHDVVAQLHAEDARPLTWQKVLDTPIAEEDIPITPRPISSHHVALKPLSNKGQTLGYLPPRLFFWVSLLTILVLSLGGAFGVFVSFGHSNTSASAPTLQASSNTIAIGATLTLHGSNFSPNGRIGLTRDAILPIADTGGASIIQADNKGNFTDTVTVSPDWQAGFHLLNAEDAKLHKIARVSLIVTGKSTSLRPAHFTLSTTTLDLGTGDIATNSTQQLILSNTGGGQITWQGSSDSPWLLLSPDNGTFASGAKMPVTIAVDRTNLHPGPYTAHVNFLSNVGSMKVTVTMQVVPLDPGHEAVLAISPAVLSFTAPDGGTAPPTQTITVSNPGVLPLQWSIATNASWLNVSPISGSVQNASSAAGATTTTTRGVASQNVTVGINTSTLLPGTYNGVITFTGQGQVKSSPQNVQVSITVTPQCGLQVSPSLLTFAGVSQQSSPTSKTINVGVSQGSCNAPISWSATTTASWLTLSASSGTTPTLPLVSVNSAGLDPGTYNASIVFSTSTGTETLPVSFTLGQPATPTMNVSAGTLAYNGVVGQASPTTQNVAITNTSGGTLNWQASVATSVGGNWLSVANTGGSLTTNQSATVPVTAIALNTLNAGTYNGVVTITGNDGNGHSIAGSPQVIPVSFVVQAACTVSTGPAALTFTGVIGQAAPIAQSITIATSGACSHAVDWTATSSTSWLVPAPATGVVSPGSAGKSSISIASAGLAAGSYSSTLTISAVDGVTHRAIGTPSVVSVALTIQQACTLQAPSTATEAFATIVGKSPAAQTFSLAVGGACSGNIAITPTVTLGSGKGWLTVTPATATVLAGGTATFTVTVIGTSLASGSYGGSITLAGVNGGATIAGSPQTVGITVTVSAPPSLAASAGIASTHGTDGVTAQPVNIANTGGTALNWFATLANAPAFVSLAPVAGSLAAGTNTSIGVMVNPASAIAGNYTANVTITATDPATGLVAVGSPTTVQITINIAPPSMQLNTTSLTYSTPAGTNPAAQSINITNIGGGTLTWTAGTPSASWLSISPTSGSDTPNVTSSPVFNVSVAGLAAGTYTATVVVTPSVGSAVTVTTTVTVKAVTPTPTIGVTPTPIPTTGVTPTSVPTVGVTPTSVPTTGVTPTPTSGVTPAATTNIALTPKPTVGVTPTPTAVTPTPTVGVTPTPTLGITPTPTVGVTVTPTVGATATATRTP